jgi:hypothetical protein
MAWKPRGGSFVMPPAINATRLRDAALVGAIFPQAGLRIDVVVDGSAETIVVRRIREKFDLAVNRPDSFNASENVGCLLLRVGREAKPLRTTVLRCHLPDAVRINNSHQFGNSVA